MSYSTIETANLFNVARETIRKWAIEFQDYLSATARPPKDGVRRFTENDIVVFALVAEMKEQGKIFDDIHAALRAGERGELPSNPTNFQSIQPSINNRELSILQEEVIGLRTEVERLKRYEAQHELLNKMLADAHAKIDLLNQQIGRLTSKL